MAQYGLVVLAVANDELPINLDDGNAEDLLVQVDASGATTPVLALEVSLDGGVTFDDVEVEDLDALGTALGTITASGLYQPRASHFGAAPQARVRLVSIAAGSVGVVASTARRS